MTADDHGEAVTSNRDTLVKALHNDSGHRYGGSARACDYCKHHIDALMPTVEAMLAQARAEVMAAVVSVLPKCEHFVRGYTCASEGRDISSPYGADGYCTPCQVLAALATVSGIDHDTTLDTVRAREDGIRQAMTWLRADYTYGEGPDWREDGAQWIADRLADETKARADRIAPDDTPSERGGDDAA